ncbi:MAG: aldehyde oxidase [Acidobacteria bacterium]|nr:MAG: aldehyde oxidase [Acidobacteriota bacterium]
MIGQSPPRPDGLSKVDGSACYADDFVLPGMLFGATVRSPIPHARIDTIRWQPEKAPAGAFCLTALDLPGPNGVLLLNDDWPILADNEVRHVGEPVALVAAASRLDARRALAAVEVEYTPLDSVLDLSEADPENPLAVIQLEHGDVERALGASDVVVEGEYRTGHQEHIYIECQAMTAWYEPDGALVVKGSMQCPYYVHKALVHALELPPERVRAEATVVGGGFGGKEDYPSLIALHAALLAKATGRPVRIAYDRHEDIVGTTKRHPSVIRHVTGIDEQGQLMAMDVDLLLDGGSYTTLTPVVLSRAALHAGGVYRCPNVRIRARALRTNTATNGAFRGFGAPEAEFAVERQMDRVARAMGLDPLEIRLRNVLEEGDELPTGQVLDDTTSARLCLEKAAALTDFRRRWSELEEERRQRADGEPMRGLGLSAFFHGAGFTGNGERRMRSPVKVALREDGRIEVFTAMIDMGQGSAVVFPQIACEAGGLTEDDLVFAEPDTARVPDSGPTVASRTTMVIGRVLAEAIAETVELVQAWWRGTKDLEEDLTVAEGAVQSPDGSSWTWREVAASYVKEKGSLEVSRRYEPPAWQQLDEETYQGVAYPTYGWGADVVEVEVDPDTLEVKAQKVTAVCEVGKAIHPTLCAGQIEGGTLQAVSWGLMEEVKMEEGRYLNDRLATYIIPTIGDSPEIEVHLLEQPYEGGPFGAKGVGELPMDGGAPAALAAVENATGIWADEIPATPERLTAWQEAGDVVESIAGEATKRSSSED